MLGKFVMYLYPEYVVSVLGGAGNADVLTLNKSPDLGCSI